MYTGHGSIMWHGLSEVFSDQISLFLMLPCQELWADCAPHFWLQFWIIFIVWQKNETKMATVNYPKHKHLENEAKMNFAWTSAVLGALGTFKLPFGRLDEIIFLSPYLPHDSLTLFTSLFIKFHVQNKLEYVLLTTKITTKKKKFRWAHVHHSGFTHCVALRGGYV